jgi:hypothetical protein
VCIVVANAVQLHMLAQTCRPTTRGACLTTLLLPEQPL